VPSFPVPSGSCAGRDQCAPRARRRRRAAATRGSWRAPPAGCALEVAVPDSTAIPLARLRDRIRDRLEERPGCRCRSCIRSLRDGTATARGTASDPPARGVGPRPSNLGAKGGLHPRLRLQAFLNRRLATSPAATITDGLDCCTARDCAITTEPWCSVQSAPSDVQGDAGGRAGAAMGRLA